MQRQDFAALTAFAAIVRHGSFARAAEQLGVTASALSQTIRALEERLDVRLLHRTTRSVAVSEAGARLIRRLGPALAELDAAVAEVDPRAAAGRGSLRLTMPRMVAVRMLAPLLGRFQEAHPDITLELALEDSLTDIVKRGFDAGIRLVGEVDRDMVAVRLGGDLRVAVVAAPAYLARHGEPRKPRDLLRHRCIEWRMPTSAMLFRWEFVQRGRTSQLAVDGPLIVNDTDLAVAAAVAGAGVAYVAEAQAADEIAAGRLVPLLAAWMPTLPGFQLYYPSRHVSPPLRCWLGFLRAEGLLGRARPGRSA